MKLKWITEVLGAVGGAIIGILGGWDGLLIMLVTVIAIDYVTGVTVAIMGNSSKTPKGGLNSTIGFKGILKKFLEILVVALAAVIDKYVGNGEVFRSATILFFVANEGISILENVTAVGLPVPAKLKNMLEQIKGDGEEDMEDLESIDYDND